MNIDLKEMTQLAPIFRELFKGYHLSRSEPEPYAQLSNLQDQYRALFKALGFELVCDPRGFYYFVPEQAGAHPTWSMGPMNTLNSASLVNKGLELIETHLLFGVAYDRIDVVVHPQSIVHSMVTFIDGSTIAQASPPDMRLPIALALGWPQRVPGAAAACDFTSASTGSTWTFEPVDAEVFPAVELARYAGERGGSLPAVYNAANEEAAAAFLDGRIGFPRIVATIADVLHAADQWAAKPATVDEVLDAQRWATAQAARCVEAVTRKVITTR